MAEDGDDEWKFSVDEVGPDDADDPVDGGSDDGSGTDSADGEDTWGTTVGEDDDGPTVRVGDPERAVADDGDGEGGNVAGSLSPEEPVEPGTPAVENAVFVTAGALLAVLVFASLVVSDPFVLAGLAVAVIAASAGLYAIFARF